MNEALAVWSCFGFFLSVAAIVIALVAKAQAVRAIRKHEELSGRVASLQEKLTQAYQRLVKAESQLAQAPPGAPEPAKRVEPPKEKVQAAAPPAVPAAMPRPPAKPVEPPPAVAPPTAVPPLPPVAVAPPAAGAELFEEAPSPASPPPPAAKPSAEAVPPPPPRIPAKPPVPLAAPRPPAPPFRPAEPKEEGGWEKKLGLRLPVWIGAIALVLAGIFLVKYSIDRGLLTDTMKVTLATILGVALLGAGEWLRKKTPAPAQGASAAGIAILYAAFLAGTILYHLMNPWVGFGFLALLTAAAVALSLRQGIVVAVIGLVGGFFTPYWIGIISASPARLFAYLLLLQAGLLVVTRKRQWTGLAALTLVMGIGAVLHRLGAETVLNDAPWVGLFLLVSTAAFVFAAKKWKDVRVLEAEGAGALPVNRLLGYGALLTAFLGLAVLAARTRFQLQEWGFFGILALAALVLGRLDKQYDKMPWVAFAVTLVLQAGWVLQSRPEEVTDIWIVAACSAVLFGVGGFISHHGSAFPASWATLSAAGGLAAFGLAWWADKLHDKTVPHWGYASLGLALLYLAMTVSAARPARRKTTGEATLAAFCVAVTAFVSFSVPLELERHWLTVAWALEVAALAWLLLKLRVKALGVLGILLAAGVAVRLLLNPEVLDYPLGATPVFNWILYGYGLSALAIAVAAWLYGRALWRQSGGFLAWIAGALTFALLTLEVRQGFHPERLLEGKTRIVEWSTYSHLWILAGLLLLGAYLKWGRTVVGFIGGAFLGIAGLKILLVDILLANPLWNKDFVGDIPVFNWLLYAYALAVLGFALGAWLLGRTPWGPAKHVATALAGLVGLVFLALEVRQGFQGGILPGEDPTIVELATYSHAWLGAALLLLFVGRLWGKTTLRTVGAVFAAVAVFKLFVVDLLAANPMWSHHEVGEWPFVNWLLYVYGVPALALWAVKPLLADASEALKWLGGLSRAAVLLLGFALLTLEVRQFFHPGLLDSGRFTLLEVATYGHAWLLLAAGLILGWRKWGDVVAGWGGKVLYGLAVLKVLLLDVLVCNPLIWHQDVGAAPVFNWLLFVYGLPILLLIGMSRLPAGEEWKTITAPVAFYGGLLMSLLLLTLEVRQFFHPNFLDAQPLQDMENYAYSAAWILYAVVLLAVGIAKGARVPRVASLIVMFLAVSKVFIYDLRHLKDLYRVGSFFALGLSLLLISFLYQRFVFRVKDHE